MLMETNKLTDVLKRTWLRKAHPVTPDFVL